MNTILLGEELLDMRIAFDRYTCIGAFQCVDEWDAFRENRDEGKADLVDANETRENIFVREIPQSAEEDAQWAARVCPVDAITVYDDDGNQLIP